MNQETKDKIQKKFIEIEDDIEYIVSDNRIYGRGQRMLSDIIDQINDVRELIGVDKIKNCLDKEV